MLTFTGSHAVLYESIAVRSRRINVIGHLEPVLFTTMRVENLILSQMTGGYWIVLQL